MRADASGPAERHPACESGDSLRCSGDMCLSPDVLPSGPEPWWDTMHADSLVMRHAAFQAPPKWRV